MRISDWSSDVCSSDLEASNIALARELVSAYRGMTPAQRLDFFLMLDREFGPDRSTVMAAALAYREDPSPEAVLALAQATDPPRRELFRRVNMLPEGTEFCISPREAVPDLLPEHSSDRRRVGTGGVRQCSTGG